MVRYRSVQLKQYERALGRGKKKGRRGKKENSREELKKIKTKKIEREISIGDKLVDENRLRDAPYRYLSAKYVTTDYNRNLTSYCVEKVKFVQNLVNQALNNELEVIIEEIKRLFLANKFTEIEPVARKFFDRLKEFEWVQISIIFEEFQCIMLDYWEVIFPKLVTLADDYYDKKQHKQAMVMFAICKDVVKKLKFSPNRTHLIEAFMRYEMICAFQIIIAEMCSLVERARDLMDSNKKQEAIAVLNAINDLESKIPAQFRDKKRLRDLHSKMNQLREDSYK